MPMYIILSERKEEGFHSFDRIPFSFSRYTPSSHSLISPPSREILILVLESFNRFNRSAVKKFFPTTIRSKALDRGAMKSDSGVPSLGLSIDLSISVQSQQQQQNGYVFPTRPAPDVGDGAAEEERRGSTMDLLPRPVAHKQQQQNPGLLWQSLWTKSRSDSIDSNGTEAPSNCKGLDMNRVPCSGDIEDTGGVSTSFQLMAAAEPASSRVARSADHQQAKREREVDEAEQMISSRAASDEEEGGTRKKLRLSKEQSALLEDSFREHSTLNPKQKNALAKQLNLRPRQVEVWFQNRRARTKLKQTEVDCELLKKYCEGLSEENRRLQKELQELRALKISPPCVITHDFYMPLPATTLTMCPSCERLASMDNNASGSGAKASSKPLSTSFQNTTMARFAPQPRTTPSLLQPV